MRVMMIAALAATASASFVQVHRATHIPSGWKATAEQVEREAVFHNVLVGLKRSNVDELSALLQKVSDPQGEQYLDYPTYEQVGDMVRPPAENTAVVKAWLRRNGVMHVTEHPHGDALHLEATAGQLEALAGGQFTTYVHESGMKVHRITSGINVPSEVAAVIDTFSGFHGFPLRPEAAKMPKAQPVGACSGCVVTPPFLRNVYNVTAVPKSGKTNIQAIGQYQGQYVSDSDLASFCTAYDPASGSCKIDKYVGKDDQKEPGIESMLDTEYIVPLGNSTTWVYSYPNFDFCNDLIAFGTNVTSETVYPYSISISYGSQKIDFCEASLITRFSQDIQKFGVMGITVMISSGDDGSGHSTRQGTNAGKLSPSYPASIPYAVAVGSTYFVSGTSGQEQATTQFGSGGGFSYDFDAPSYQTSQIATYLSTVELPKTYAYAKTGRGSPDVSALGEAFTVRVSGSDYAVGGTSASSPSFAGFVTILNEVCLSVGGKTLGFANPFFYANPQAFRDVTAGTNAIGGNTEGWKAIKGWDASTGLGTPNVAALITAVRASCAKAARRN
eukprot:TRINITY_DN85_c1_g1_i4.p1 TRINITY_DN85_c1_g1~~TRINITY_DN85_c1_g1_i4.p1  ORF type:complete len:558 (+),score=220.70 TRINITY_DN85_c1_g1_i4:76-1749(+)